MKSGVMSARRIIRIPDRMLIFLLFIKKAPLSKSLEDGALCLGEVA